MANANRIVQLIQDVNDNGGTAVAETPTPTPVAVRDSDLLDAYSRAVISAVFLTR